MPGGPPAAGSSHTDTLASGDPSLHTCPAGPACYVRAQPGLVSSSWVFNQMSSGRGGNTSQEGWGHGRHLPLALGQLLSAPCRGGRAWTPGLLDPGTPDAAHSAHRGRTPCFLRRRGLFTNRNSPGSTSRPRQREGASVWLRPLPMAAPGEGLGPPTEITPQRPTPQGLGPAVLISPFPVSLAMTREVRPVGSRPSQSLGQTCSCSGISEISGPQ